MTTLLNIAGGAGRRLAASLIVIAATIVGAEAADTDVVATVNGKAILQGEVDMALEIFGSQLAQVPADQRQHMVVDALVDMHLVADAAKAAGFSDNARFKTRMAFLEAQALRNTYVEDEIQNAVTEDEIKARYETEIAAYKAPEEVHARHILVKTEDEAKAIIAELAAGGDFEAIAKEKSIDPGSKGNGGDLGFFSKGQMVPEFEEAAFALQPGEVSKEPVKTQFGYHVIKVEEKRQKPAPTLEEIHDDVAQMVQRDKYRDLMTKLRASAKIERADLPAPDTATSPAEEAPAK